MIRASTYGAGTVINAIATLKGSAFAIGLKTQAEVEVVDSGITCEIADNPSADTSLIAECGRLVVERYAPKSGVHIVTRSEIPIASGLKSSSAAANAAVLALVEALDVELEPLDIVKLGVLAARRAGVTVTGAFDDACASFFGGLVFTDNEHDVLLKRVEINATGLSIHPAKQSVFSEGRRLASKTARTVGRFGVSFGSQWRICEGYGVKRRVILRRVWIQSRAHTVRARCRSASRDPFRNGTSIYRSCGPLIFADRQTGVGTARGIYY